MNCKKVKELIMTDYIDANLDRDKLKLVEAHILSCVDCRTVADDLLRARKALSGLKTQAPSPAVWERIKLEVEAGLDYSRPVELLQRAIWYLRSHLKPVTAIATAALIAVFILSATLFFVGRNIIPVMPAGQSDIVSIVSIDQPLDEEDAGFGTAAEQFFL